MRTESLAEPATTSSGATSGRPAGDVRRVRLSGRWLGQGRHIGQRGDSHKGKPGLEDSFA